MMKNNIIVFMVLAAALLAPSAGAFAQSKDDIVNASYSGPVFQDAFWTNRTTAPPDGTSLEKVEVSPGDGSVLAVVLVNRGLSDITAISGTLSLPSGFRTASGSSQGFATHNEIVAPGAVFTLFFELDVSRNARVQGYNSPLTVEFSRVLEVGQFRSSELSVPFRLTGKVILDAVAVNRDIVPGSASEVEILVSNKGSAPATGVVVTLGGGTAADASNDSSASAAAGTVIVGQKAFDLGTIPVNGSAEIRPLVFAGSSAGETPQAVNLQVSYGNAYGVKQTANIPVGLVVLPRALNPDLDIAPSGNLSTVVTAGKIHDYQFTVSNVADRPLTDVLITLSPQSETIRILGDSTWRVSGMDADYAGEFTTQVFAPVDLIGTPTTFNVDIRYLAAGQSKADSVDLGAYVDGEINIHAYEIAVDYIGGVPNVSGNLLNEGNTVALFTNIEVVSAEGIASALPPSQYLGDLEENSPLPFSIPIDVDPSAGAGTYPVALKVTYKDNLRQEHVLDVSADVQFAPEQATDESQAPSSMSLAAPVGIGVAIVAAIVAFVVIRSRKKKSLARTMRSKKQDDIEALLDSQRAARPDERK